MKKKLLNLLVSVVLVCGTILAVPANAETKTENGKTYQEQVGWIMDENDDWHYYNENHELVKNATISKNGIDYKLDANGKLTLDDATVAKIKAKNAELESTYGYKCKYEGSKEYYLDASGQKTGWVEDDGKMYYYNQKGELQKDTTVKDCNGKDVKLSKNGVVVGEHGYELLNGKEVTYDSSETYKKNDSHWKKTGDDWSYNYSNKKDGNQVLATDWDQINGVWYYFNDKGVMQKNITVKDEKGNECVLNADGALTNRTKPEFDFSKVSNKVIYTQKVIDGKTYYVDAKGEKKIGWVFDNGKWHYTNKDGVMQKDIAIIEGDNKYVLGSDGVWIN